MKHARAALIGIALAALASACMAQPNQNFPTAGAASVVTTGGTAVVAVLASTSQGCYIINPLSATDQGVTVEPLYVNPVTTATTAGNGTTAALAPGQTYSCPANSSVAVSVNAATSGHKFTVVRW